MAEIATSSIYSTTVGLKDPGPLRMESKLELIYTLLGGTESMRDAAQKYLPQEPKEEDEWYILRLNRSVLYNAVASAVDRVVSRPFSKKMNITGGENLHDRLKPILKNADRKGTDLHTFAKELYREAIEGGFEIVLVDYPRVNLPEGQSRPTLRQEQQQNLYPYFTRISASQLLGHTSVIDPITQEKAVTQLRYKVVSSEPMDGDPYLKTDVEKVVIYSKDLDSSVGSWQVWVEDNTSDANSGTITVNGRLVENREDFIAEGLTWRLEDEGELTYSGPGLPVAVFYASPPIGDMEAYPVFEDLAWLNVAHWQTSSDTRDALRMVLKALLVVMGFTEDELKTVIVSSNTTIRTTRPPSEADVRYVEHSGRALKAGNDELKFLEERMEILGLRPFVERTSRSTATGKMIDDDQTSNDIQSWIRDLEAFLVRLFQIAAIWVATTIQEDLQFDIYDEFSLPFRSSEDGKLLLEAFDKRLVDQRTILSEFKKRSVLSASVNIEDVIAAVIEEVKRATENTSEVTSGTETVVEE